MPAESDRSLPRHPAWVRATHWLGVLAFLALLLSGIAILLAHPRLYWGETGARQGPSLVDLPLPFVLDVPIRGPGRYIHFLAAGLLGGQQSARTLHFVAACLLLAFLLVHVLMVAMSGFALRMRGMIGGH